MIDWHMLVHDHTAAIHGIAWRILGHAQDAEDVTQEVFAEAHRLSNGTKIECWAAFLRRIATCRALDALRRRRITMPLKEERLASNGEAPEEIATSRELQARLRAALKDLPAREAEVFCLRYFEDLSYREIARTLEISPTATSTALYQARVRLEKLLIEPNKRGLS